MVAPSRPGDPPAPAPSLASVAGGTLPPPSDSAVALPPSLPPLAAAGWSLHDGRRIADYAAPLVYASYVPGGGDRLFYLFGQSTIPAYATDPAARLRGVWCTASGERMRLVERHLNTFTCEASRPLLAGEVLSVAVVPDEDPLSVRVLHSEVVFDGHVDGDASGGGDGNTAGPFGSPTASAPGATAVPVDAAAAPRYHICAVTQVDGPDYLLDWLDYHRRIGVDHYYLYDNSLGGPTRGSGSLAAAGLASRPDTDVLVWPWRKSQAQAFSHALLLGRRRCEWLLFADVDEFVYVPADARSPTPGALRRLLDAATQRGAAQVSLSRLEMGPGGAVRRRLSTSLAETNIRRRGGGGLWNNYKSAVRPAAARPSSRVHFAELAAAPPLGGGDDFSRVWPALTRLRAWAFYDRWDTRGYVIHYRAKSWEDFLDKWANHDQNGMVPNPAGGFRRHRFSVGAPPAFWWQYGGTRRDVAFRDYKRVVDAWALPPPVLVWGGTREGKQGGDGGAEGEGGERRAVGSSTGGDGNREAAAKRSK